MIAWTENDSVSWMEAAVIGVSSYTPRHSSDQHLFQGTAGQQDKPTRAQVSAPLRLRGVGEGRWPSAARSGARALRASGRKNFTGEDRSP